VQLFTPLDAIIQRGVLMCARYAQQLGGESPFVQNPVFILFFSFTIGQIDEKTG